MLPSNKKLSFIPSVTAKGIKKTMWECFGKWILKYMTIKNRQLRDINLAQSLLYAFIFNLGENGGKAHEEFDRDHIASQQLAVGYAGDSSFSDFFLCT